MIDDRLQRCLYEILAPGAITVFHISTLIKVRTADARRCLVKLSVFHTDVIIFGLPLSSNLGIEYSFEYLIEYSTIMEVV